jgi:hypothetical protein
MRGKKRGIRRSPALARMLFRRAVPRRPVFTGTMGAVEPGHVDPHPTLLRMKTPHTHSTRRIKMHDRSNSPRDACEIEIRCDGSIERPRATAQSSFVRAALRLMNDAQLALGARDILVLRGRAWLSRPRKRLARETSSVIKALRSASTFRNIERFSS